MAGKFYKVVDTHQTVITAVGGTTLETGVFAKDLPATDSRFVIGPDENDVDTLEAANPEVAPTVYAGEQAYVAQSFTGGRPPRRPW